MGIAFQLESGESRSALWLGLVPNHRPNPVTERLVIVMSTVMKSAPHSSGSGPSGAAPRRFGSVRSLVAGLLALTSGALAVGCLERPVEPIQPNTSNVFVDYIPNSQIDKIDLLFVVDNSVSMADKQAILEKAVPRMVQRLVNPNCVNQTTGESVDNTTGTCDGAAGFAQEFQPINDIHIGVISSSLGGHGATTYMYGCSDEPPQNDRALLMPRVRTPAEGPLPEAVDGSGNGLGFLAWQPAADLPAADKAALATQLSADFARHVVASGETGCGFEATLESWYRFLVDPSPPAGLVVTNAIAATTGRDDGIIAQRNAFLRDDSLVAIIVLSDENDCSAMEGGPFYANAGYGWLVADVSVAGPNGGSMFGGFPPAATICEENPNDRCCFSCLQGAPPADCPNTCPAAVNGAVPPMPGEFDRVNSRCFDSQRRFGIDLLYPTSRYVSGLSDQRIVDSQTGESVDNPLLVHPVTGQPRPPGLVFYAAIVGVPWQDIATPESLTGPGLDFLTAAELGSPRSDVAGEPTTWDIILGQPNLHPTDPACADGDAKCGAAPLAPLDPLMIESIGPRQGANPITGDALVQPGGAGANPINGHEYDNSVPYASNDPSPANDDLQYACIFQLDTPNVDCTIEEDPDCDCGGEPSKNRPLCKATPDGAAPGTTTQSWAKAYPGLRFLEVARDFGANSILGSICPKVLDETQADFGYNPAVNAIVDRLAETLKGQCLPRSLSLENGEAPCAMVEALGPAAKAEQGITTCTDGREAVKPELVPAVLQQLEEARLCTGAACNDWLLCAIPQHVAGTPEGVACFASEAEAPPADQAPGYCYIDPAKGPTAGGQGCTDDEATWINCTNPNTDSCGPTEKRILRFVGPNTPRKDSATVVACTADAASGSPVLPDVTAPPATGGGSN